MSKQATLKFSVLAVAALFSAQTWAGLGKINVRSHLGEPLSAEIVLTGNDLGSAQVGLADIDTFRNLQVDFTSDVSALRFSLIRRGGTALIRVSSSRPINEPFLRFVVEAKTGTGKAVREYTVLLDPPEYRVRQPETIVQSLPRYADENQSARYSRNPVPRSKPKVPGLPKAAPEALRAMPGDTLAAMAARLRPSGATQPQTMAALMQANPNAFINGDPNRLIAGKLLKMPKAAEVKAISASQARSILNGNAVAAAQPVAPAKPAEAKPAPVPAKPAAQPEVAVKPAAEAANKPAAPQAPVAPAATGKEVLKLTAPEASVPTEDRLSELEYQVAEREQALKDAEARIAALESRLKSAQPASAPAEPAKPAAEPEQSGPGLMDTVMEYLPLAGGALAVVALGVLGLGVARRRKQGASAEKPAAVATAASSGLAAAAITGGAGATQAMPSISQQTQGGHSFMSDFTRSFGDIDAGEVDPVAEADVYIAYGRDQQAEEILREALNKDPARHEVRQKLLEIYASRQDTAAFEATARELHDTFDGKGQQWQRAAALGLTIDPANALYQTKVADAPAAAVVADAGLDDLEQELSRIQGEIPAAPMEVAPSAPVEIPATPITMDFDDPFAELDSTDAGGVEAVAVTESAAGNDGNMLDFDLSGFGESVASVDEPAEAEAPAAADAGNMLDFDFQLDSLIEGNAAEAAPAAAAPLDMADEPALNDLSAYFGDSAIEEAAPAATAIQDDPLTAKLDLAKVYLEMGDSDGAREVLNELLTEAQGPLKDEAQALLGQLGS